MITTIQALLNSGSKAMNVNGSVSSKTFSYTASSDSVVTGFMCILKDEGTTNLNNFGAISALTNGLLLQATQDSNTRTIATIKDNGDLSTVFHFNQFGNSAVLSILGIVTAQGFGNSNNVFVGFLEFHHPVMLANGDSISALVQDNLTNIDFLQMSCKVCLD